MDITNYNTIIEKQINKCKEMISSKRSEYANDKDPLNNFNRAGNLLGKTPIGALAGMMSKHTISVYDMLKDHEAGRRFSKEKWDEKITDSINYLLLLQTLLEEDRGLHE